MASRLLSWIWRSDAAQTQTLVAEREAPLAENTKKIDDIARLKEELKACFEAVKKAHPNLVESLHASSTQPISSKEMGEMLKILVLSTAADLQELDGDLQEVRRNREKLQQLVQIWTRINGNLDLARERVQRATTLDETNIEDLTALNQQLREMGACVLSRTDGAL